MEQRYPPIQEYFVRDFGYDGNTPAALEVLQGTYTPPPECDPTLCYFLSHCKLPPDILLETTSGCPKFITTEGHQQGWKKAKEHTQAGRSGLSFAITKADALDPELAALDVSSRNIAYASGFSYS